MATLERYSSFEEMDEAQLHDNKSYAFMLKKKKKPVNETPGQKAFREFGEIFRKGIVPTPAKKNNPQSTCRMSKISSKH